MKKILIFSLLVIPIVLFWNSREDEKVSFAEKVSRMNLSKNKASPLKKNNLPEKEDIHPLPPSSSKSDRKSKLEDKAPAVVEEKKVSTEKDNSNDNNTRKRTFKRKKPLNSKTSESSPSGQGTSPKAKASGGGGVPGVPVIPSSGKTLVVTETGEGETMLLQEAFRLLNTGDQILLKEGHYTPLMNHLSLPSFELKGEGNESVLEINDTLKVSQFDLKLTNLKVINSATGPTIVNENGKGLVIENVLFQGNGNDGIRSVGGQLQLTKIEMQNFNRALNLKNPASFSGNNIEISNSSYGIHLEANKNQKIIGLKTESMGLFSVFFVPNSTCNLECQNCSLGENDTNRRSRLKLIK